MDGFFDLCGLAHILNDQFQVRPALIRHESLLCLLAISNESENLQGRRESPLIKIEKRFNQVGRNKSIRSSDKNRRPCKLRPRQIYSGNLLKILCEYWMTGKRI